MFKKHKSYNRYTKRAINTNTTLTAVDISLIKLKGWGNSNLKPTNFEFRRFIYLPALIFFRMCLNTDLTLSRLF